MGESASFFLSRNQIRYDGLGGTPTDADVLVNGMISLLPYLYVDDLGDLQEVVYEPTVNSGSLGPANFSPVLIRRMNMLEQQYNDCSDVSRAHELADQLSDLRGKLGYGPFEGKSDLSILEKSQTNLGSLARILEGQVGDDTPGLPGPWFFSVNGFNALTAYSKEV